MDPAQRTDIDPSDFVQESDIKSAFGLVADLIQDFSSSLDIRATLEKTLQRIAEHMNAEAGSLWLVNDEGTKVVCEASVGSEDISGISVKWGQGIVGASIANNVSKSVLDVTKDPEFNQAVDQESGFVTRSILCAPMSLSGKAIGAVQVLNRIGDDQCFREEDGHLLQIMATSAALIMSNMTMASSLAEAESVRKELNLAAEIQKELLPTSVDQSFPVAGVNRPARTVSGDLYGFVETVDRKIMFCVGDVSGKGINASLLMSKTSSLFHCLGKYISKPADLLKMINDELAETSSRGMFVTMLIGVYDRETGEVCIANAGHEPPLLRMPNGKYLTFEESSVPLGILAGVDYSETTFYLTDSRFYIFTDGVTEAVDDKGEELEAEGLKKIIDHCINQDKSECIEGALWQVADEISRTMTLKDDLTLLEVDIEKTPYDLRHYEKKFSLKIAGRPESLKTIRQVLESGLECFGVVDELVLCDIVLAVDEVCQNVIRHGYEGGYDKPLELLVKLQNSIVQEEEQVLVIYISDEAPRVDQETLQAKKDARDINEVRPGGLGLHIIQEVMDYFHYIDVVGGKGNSGNCLESVKKLA
jgi:sigma-B regulation protein RsbU (phosphoserine phosphatase)